MSDEFVTAPHDDGAERALLGMVLDHERALVDVADRLKPDDFYTPKHGIVFAAACAVRDAGDPVNPVTVLAELERRNAVGKVGGAAYLHELYSQPPGGSAGWYANRIADKAGLRRIVAAGQRVVQIGAGATDGAEAAGEAARQILDAAVQSTRSAEAPTAADDLIRDAERRYQSAVASKQPTGLSDLDKLFGGGLREGGLYVVAARPGVGKSVLACVLAANVAEAGHGVFFASLEMTKEEVIDRMVARKGRIDLSHIEAHDLNAADYARFGPASEAIARWPLFVLDTPNMGLTTIRAKARDLTRTARGLGLVVVDYLQLITPADPRQPREQQVAAFSRGLKLLAKELRCPVLALAQLNRGPEQRAGGKPALSDLRESGAIEADSDAVLLLYDDPEAVGELQVYIGKNRHGRRGELSLAWQPHYGSAGLLATEPEPRRPNLRVAE